MSENIRRFDQTSSPDVRQRFLIADQEAKRYLDGLIERILAHRAVEHPFLTRYAQKGLNKEGERKLFSECFYFFRWLPFYIAGMANATRDELIMRELLLNVQDEVGDGKTKLTTHSTIFNQFLHDIGISAQDIETYRPLETTTALNEGIRKLYTESHIMKALGALYADETMSATMVSKLNDGLKTQGYDEKIRYFWMLHMEAEVGHSNSVFNAIHSYIHDPGNRAQFEAGLMEFLNLLEAYWDGVDRIVYGSGSGQNLA